MYQVTVYNKSGSVQATKTAKSKKGAIKIAVEAVELAPKGHYAVISDEQENDVATVAW